MRAYMAFSAVLLAGLAYGAPACAEQPNVLFIAVDDLNDWISCLAGHPQSRTPNIDRLAARGVLFTNAHCASPSCNPSRVALMTGLRSSTTGVYNNNQPFRPVLPHAVTLTQHFMQHGYAALGAGKIFHGSFPDQASWNDYRPVQPSPKPSAEVRKDPHSKSGGITWGRLDCGDAEMADYKTVDYCIEQLNKDHGKPFFLACGLIRPHMPWQVPEEYYERYPLKSVQLPNVLDTDLDDLPPAGVKMARPQGDHATMLQTGNWQYAVQGYLATIAFCDAQVGRLLDALDASRHAGNTIVVFWTDHGWHLGEKQHWRKFALWERATRTPLAIVVPGLTKVGVRCDRAVSLLDLYPTLAELCALPARSELEGTSLVPLLKNPQAPRTEPAVITYGRGNHAVRTDRYRYIRYADGGQELYDHSGDPNEWTNLADRSDLRGVIDELARWLPAEDAPDAPRVAEEPGVKRKQRVDD